MREFWERNHREKQDWLIHNLIHLILQIPLLSPSPLSYPWEDHKPNPYLTKFKVVRRFLVFRKQFKRELIHIGWCNGLFAGSGKLEETRFGVTLLEQEAWRVLVLWVFYAWVYCYSFIPTDFLVDHLSLEGRRRGFSPTFSVFSSITCASVILYLYLFFLYSLLLISVSCD